MDEEELVSEMIVELAGEYLEVDSSQLKYLKKEIKTELVDSDS